MPVIDWDKLSAISLAKGAKAYYALCAAGLGMSTREYAIRSELRRAVDEGDERNIQHFRQLLERELQR